MVTEKDVYRSANAVIKKCGNSFDPKAYAHSMMNRFYESGDTEGATVWAKVANAITDILNVVPAESLH